MDWFESAKERVANWKAQNEAAEARWQKYTPRAQRVLQFAREEASRLGHHFTGVEHLLFGLLNLGQGISCSFLTECGLSLQDVRQEIEKHTGIYKELPVETPLTPRMKRVLDQARKEILQKLTG